MTQKVILLPVERVKALEKLTTDSKRPLPLTLRLNYCNKTECRAENRHSL